MYALMTMASYCAILLLTMPATGEGVLQTGILLVCGVAVLLWRKPWVRGKKIQPSKPAYFAAALFALALGCKFYERWLPSSKVRTIASLVHLPHQAFIAAVAAALALCAVYAVSRVLQRGMRVLQKGEKPLFRSIVSCLAATFATVALSQWMIGAEVFSMGYLKFACGMLLVAVAIGSLFLLSGSVAFSAVLGTSLFMLLSTVNVYVYRFRGRLFEPVDIFSFGTAMNVADHYSLLPIPGSVAAGWGIWLGLVIIYIYISETTKTGEKARLSGRHRAALALCVLTGAMCTFAYATNLKTYHWQREGAIFNGYILDFVSKLKEAHVAEPDGYAPESIAALSERYAQDAESEQPEADPPHIIVIMDEAFSDLSVLGEITTNEEVMPFFSSLKDRAVTGYALASVYGGNTANSEYEFLTGNSMAWMSPNVVPYQQYMRSATYSMVSYLKINYDYRCIALHPYLSSGWNRPTAYAHLGFDESLFIEDFPQEQYIRDYVSDREMFEKIVELYETRREEHLFLFGVSMQNHGGYGDSEVSEIQPISLLGYDGSYPGTEQYLSLIHETDRALAYLISYFESVEDDVVIVFFGDHQPKLGEDFYREVCETDADTLDAQQERYKVPFFVWTNYEADGERVACTSLNYLSSYVYKAAGLALPPYQRFLAEMEERIPSINANGFYSQSSGCYLPFDMASEDERVWLQWYEQLQYNSTFDAEHRDRKLFPVLN